LAQVSNSNAHVGVRRLDSSHVQATVVGYLKCIRGSVGLVSLQKQH
jgi:hypothetical protein